MPLFKYFARDKQGRKVVNIEEADSYEGLVKKLREKELIVIKITPVTLSFKKEKKRFTHRTIRATDLLMFAYQLATMISAGVTLVKALEICKFQIGSFKLQQIVERIKIEVEKGSSFSDALRKFPKVFSDLWVGLVEIGEASGNLALVLERLAYYLEQKLEFRRKIITALLYPTILFFIAIGAVAFFILVITPKFKTIFSEFNIKIPFLTKMLFKVSSFVGKTWLVLLILIPMILFFFYKFIRTPTGKEIFDRITLRIPLLGTFLKEVSLERFSSEIATLLEAGVPIVYSLEISERSATNTILKGIIKEVKESVKKGKSLNAPLGKFDYFPPLVVQMIRIGEEVGNLTGMFKKIQEYYYKIIEAKIARFIALFEPAMIVIIGGFVGTLVIAMYLPIFRLATLGGK